MRYILLFLLLLPGLLAAVEPLKCEDDGANMFMNARYIWVSTDAGRVFNNRLRWSEAIIYSDNLPEPVEFTKTAFDFIDSFVFIDGKLITQDCFLAYDVNIEFNRMYISLIFEHSVVNFRYQLKGQRQ